MDIEQSQIQSDSQLCEQFLNHIKHEKKLFWPSIAKTYENNPALFLELSSLMLKWAHNIINEHFFETLTDGYSFFVTDVNKSQIRYEKIGQYENKSYSEVYESVYANPEHMSLYHWGVYVTTFAWEHHLKIYDFFKDKFISKLVGLDGHILELGSGSGIWGMLVMNQLKMCDITGIDISKTSIDLAKYMAKYNGMLERCQYIVDDALVFTDDVEYDAVISCFLMEHLEDPQTLLNNMSKNLKPRGYSFLTCALTAAEIDHIFEFKKESEVILMAEKAGFRVISSFSSAPSSYPLNYKYLPRSMALVLQKKENDIW
ncbi:class I SAM-dependent methyltransferase [Rivularia sp. UHCC 0363]|uniref:class I SAM-dependent methyltransferase n=1 Tax=Rivularia sp. UHCC 0363 TaxID=3110244 RepID=UPI002B2130ED|nr:class I SAM-dependent methyltransferase [Rivularia sp. UHCC 0363]MEA5598796.1 class I SAM-dependent methyltransferase [Rivularia sp. UHCC 0363]